MTWIFNSFVSESGSDAELSVTTKTFFDSIVGSFPQAVSKERYTGLNQARTSSDG
jgi:hypothetical protein